MTPNQTDLYHNRKLAPPVHRSCSEVARRKGAKKLLNLRSSSFRSSLRSLFCISYLKFLSIYKTLTVPSRSLARRLISSFLLSSCSRPEVSIGVPYSKKLTSLFKKSVLICVICGWTSPLAASLENTLITRSEFRQLILSKYHELETRLFYTGGAGQLIQAIVADPSFWQPSLATSPVTHQEAKIIANAFYDRLMELDYQPSGSSLSFTDGYPWEGFVAEQLIEAESFDEVIGEVRAVPFFSRTRILDFDDGDTLIFKDVDFGFGLEALRVTYGLGVRVRSRKIVFRTGSVTGPIIAEFIPSRTNGWDGYETKSAQLLTSVSGVHDLYVSALNREKVANFDYFTLDLRQGVKAAQNRAPLTWGQALYLFNFSIDDLAFNTDGDGLPDLWEYENFGNLNQDENGDYDGDGKINGSELVDETNPLRTDSDGDGVADGSDGNPADFYNGGTVALVPLHSGDLTAFALQEVSPTIHLEVLLNGSPAAHAPVTIQSSQGAILAINGQVNSNSLITTSSAYQTKTDGNGQLLIRYRYGIATASTNELLLTAGSEQFSLTIALDPLDDLDGDGLPSIWENFYGLNSMDNGNILLSNGASGNPDADASDNLAEYQNQTHPLVADTDGNIIYVSRNDGADTNSGLTLQNAKATLGEGTIAVPADGTIILLEGDTSYAETLLSNPNKNIRLRIEGQAKVSSN